MNNEDRKIDLAVEIITLHDHETRYLLQGFKSRTGLDYEQYAMNYYLGKLFMPPILKIKHGRGLSVIFDWKTKNSTIQLIMSGFTRGEIDEIVNRVFWVLTKEEYTVHVVHLPATIEESYTNMVQATEEVDAPVSVDLEWRTMQAVADALNELPMEIAETIVQQANENLAAMNTTYLFAKEVDRISVFGPDEVPF